MQDNSFPDFGLKFAIELESGLANKVPVVLVWHLNCHQQNTRSTDERTQIF